MSNSIIFYLMVLLPFFVQFSVYFTERKRRKLIKQTPKSKQRFINLKKLELFENNIPCFTLIYRGYFFFLLFTILTGFVAVGSIENSNTVTINPYALFCLISETLFFIFNCILLNVKRKFTKESVFKEFLAENNNIDLYPLTNKQYIFRFRINLISLVISILNLIILFLPL